MIYATHQVYAYNLPEQLDSAILSRSGNFLRCSWKGGSIVDVKNNIRNDVTMSGRFEFVEYLENGITVQDTSTGNLFSVYANGYVRQA